MNGPSTSLRLMTPDEVESLEHEIDSNFYSISVPGKDDCSSRRIICSVGENSYRWLLVEAAKTWHGNNIKVDRSEFVINLDHYKYILKNAFDLVKFKFRFEGRDELLHFDQGALIKLFDGSFEYSRAIRIFTEYHGKSLGIIKSDITGEFFTDEKEVDIQHNSLEFLINSEKLGSYAVGMLVELFSGPKFRMEDGNSAKWSSEVYDIVSRARYRKGKVRFQIITKLGRYLSEMFRLVSEEIDFEWEFPWANIKESERFFNALNAICLYHLLSVHFCAKRFNVEDIVSDQVCLQYDIETLIDDIMRISELDRGVVRSICDFLTYGSYTRNPDPALQPLIPIGPKRVAIPGIFLISSDWQRNLMSLHARVSSNSFDSSSNIFEKSMIDSVVKDIDKSYLVFKNIVVKGSGWKEEVDILIVDVERKFLLVCELRWMIRPGDAREVHHRRRAVFKKVSQVDRKLEKISGSMSSVLSQIGIYEEGALWSASAIVIIDGYGGVMSPIPNKIPIVHKDIFSAITNYSRDIVRSHAFFCSPFWLPKTNKDFKVIRLPDKICGVIFTQPGVGSTSVSYLHQSLIQYFDDCSNLDNENLRRTRWP